MEGIIASDSEGSDNSSTEEHMENVEDFTNDPLMEGKEHKTPTPKLKKKKGPGRPKKGHSKVTGLPKKCYNTRNKNPIQRRIQKLQPHKLPVLSLRMISSRIVA